MADDAEKSQDPTPHRRNKAREEGQVAKSQDLGSAIILIAGTLLVMTLGGAVVEFMGSFAQRQWAAPTYLSFDVTMAVAFWTSLLRQLATCLLPILLTMFVVAVALNVAQVGFLFLPARLAPDISRISLFKGFGRMFSMSSVMRLAFGIFKIVVVATVAFASLYAKREEVLSLVALELPAIAVFLAETLLWTSLKCGAALLVLAILDYAFQRWKHEQDLKMTPQEVREEMRNQQGDPQMIARRRAVQRQLALNRLGSAVPEADVVVTNPTELAVAIRYAIDEMSAPVVVAKGAGLIAQRIRRIALENGIPIVERKPLARALYQEVDLHDPVPEKLYTAVAEVLAYVYQLKGKELPASARRGTAA